MKILLLAPGNSIHSQRFIQMLLETGNTVVLSDTYNPIPNGAERYAFTPYPHAYGLPRLGLRTLNRKIIPRIIAFQLRQIWRRVQPDLVHVHWVDQRAYQCARANLNPLVLSCWGSDINNLFSPDSQDTDYKAKIAQAIRHADHVTADSSEILEHCQILAGRKVPSSLFYLGVDMEKFSPRSPRALDSYRKNLGIASNARIILSARALRPLMGHHWILEAFAKLARYPDFSNTVLIFKRYLPFNDGYEEKLKDRICELKLEDRILWIDAPSNDDMPLLYGIADAVVNFPERDGFPVTFFEVASCRRPVIASDLPAYADILTGSECWLVPPANVEVLKRALIDCLSASEHEIGQRLDNAYAAVQAKGERRICFSAMTKVYQSLGVERT